MDEKLEPVDGREIIAPVMTEAYALVNTVRLDYYALWQDARNCVNQIIGERKDRWLKLRGNLWVLFIEFLPKIERYIDDENLEEEDRLMMRKLVSLMTGSSKDPIKVHSLTESQTMEVYIALRWVLERNGITKYEQKDVGDWT